MELALELHRHCQVGHQLQLQEPLTTTSEGPKVCTEPWLRMTALTLLCSIKKKVLVEVYEILKLYRPPVKVESVIKEIGRFSFVNAASF